MITIKVKVQDCPNGVLAFSYDVEAEPGTVATAAEGSGALRMLNHIRRAMDEIAEVCGKHGWSTNIEGHKDIVGPTLDKLLADAEAGKLPIQQERHGRWN